MSEPATENFGCPRCGTTGRVGMIHECKGEKIWAARTPAGTIALLAWDDIPVEDGEPTT